MFEEVSAAGCSQSVDLIPIEPTNCQRRGIMKFLQSASFDALSGLLSRPVGQCFVECRLESYSCKMVGCDKKLYKSLVQHCSGSARSGLHVLAPPQSLLSLSPKKSRVAASDAEVNCLCDTISTKSLFYLISTLNASFNPDYDFSDSKSEEFSREPSVQCVTKSVDSQLTPLMSNYECLKNQLWSALDSEIGLRDCDIYSYNPDLSGDPFGEEGTIWGFNYFFYNKNRKRIVFFACRYTSVISKPDGAIAVLYDEIDDNGDRGYESDSSSSLGKVWEAEGESMDCYD